ncbi:MAG: PqqD family protein [Pseudomonadota bacterium]
MNERRWQRLPDFVSTEAEGSHVIFSIASGNYIALNSSANAIWEALADPVSEATLVDVLAGRYEVDRETAAAAVTRTLRSLAELELVKAAA